MAHFKVEEPCNVLTERLFDFYCKNFLNRCKKLAREPKWRKIFYLKFDLSLLKIKIEI